MTLDALIMLAGVLVAALPFLGFPTNWDRVLLVLLGVSIIVLGIIVRRRIATRPEPSRRETFVENAPHARHEEA